MELKILVLNYIINLFVRVNRKLEERASGLHRNKKLVFHVYGSYSPFHFGEFDLLTKIIMLTINLSFNLLISCKRVAKKFTKLKKVIIKKFLGLYLQEIS